MILSFMGVSVGVGTTVDVPVGGGGICVGEGVAVRVGGRGVAVGEGIGVSVGVGLGVSIGVGTGVGGQRNAAGYEGNRKGERDGKEQRRTLRASTRRLVSYRFVASTNYMHTATLLSGGPVVKGGGGRRHTVRFGHTHPCS